MLYRFVVIITAILLCSHIVYAEHTIAPSEYNLEVSFDIPASKITGSARINADDKELIFYTGQLKIYSATLNNQSIGFQYANGILKVSPPAAGILEIRYEGIFKNEQTSNDFNYGVVKNMISDSGISLTDTWYPHMEGLMRYRLKVYLPDGYEAVSETEEIKKTKVNGIAEFIFDYPHLVDRISLIATDRYEVIRDSYNNIEIYAYFFKEDVNLAGVYIEYTKKYLKLYEGLIGKYPFKRFSIVENFLPSGYSMPTYTLLGQDVVRLPFIVDTSLGHEILHQWFGNLVYIDYEKGNWAEGLTTYLADHLYEEQKEQGWDYRKQILINYGSYVTEKNDFPLKDFKMRVDFPSRAIGYGKAAMVFHMLKGIVGEDIFYKSLRDIIDRKRFTRVSWDDIRDIFEENYKKDIGFFFKQWIENKGILELKIDNANFKQVRSKFELSFDILQRGAPYILDVPIKIYYLNGEAFQELLKIDSETNSFRILLDDVPEKIVIDEDYDIARKLQIDEFPPVISRLLGDESLIIVLPEKDKDIYIGVIDLFKRESTLIKESADIEYSDMKNSSLLILDNDNPVIKKIFGKTAVQESGFSLKVKENPWNPEKVIGIVDSKSTKEADAAHKKIPHYGKYSHISFQNGKNTSKKIEKTVRGIQKHITEDAIVIEVSTVRKLKDIIDRLAEKKIIYVGEYHDRFSHHYIQMRIIKGLYDRRKKIAIGMEMFQRSFQNVLDEYIAGLIEEREFLTKSEYFKRWGFDYNLYKPIIDFAKNKNIPIIALNLQRELIDKVSKGGIDSLSDEEKKEIPLDLDFSDKEYRERLYEIFQKHPGNNFDFFLQSQILWDETMSMSINEFLKENPDFQIIVLAGSGHLQYGSGIPLRTFRRNENGYEYSILLNETEIDTDISNYVVFPKSIEGTTSPKLMITLSESEGKVRIEGFAPNSVSEKAGLKVGDIIVSIDGYEIRNINDIRTHLFFKQKGDEIRVMVLRKRFLLPDREIEIKVLL